jgi:HPt (histidine-containing phosphotransfer) domain-containing protein
MELGIMKELQEDYRDEVFDIRELLTRVENDRELLRELLLISIADLPKHLHGLRDAVNASAADHVASRAHTLKGMLANLSAYRAAEAAARLERLGRSGQRSGFQFELAQFEREAEMLLRELESHAEVSE